MIINAEIVSIKDQLGLQTPCLRDFDDVIESIGCSRCQQNVIAC
ncbi:TPA: hypothetical protein ACX6SJ_003829 [Photobacterium damselae]